MRKHREGSFHGSKNLITNRINYPIKLSKPIFFLQTYTNCKFGSIA